MADGETKLPEVFDGLWTNFEVLESTNDPTNSDNVQVDKRGLFFFFFSGELELSGR